MDGGFESPSSSSVMTDCIYVSGVVKKTTLQDILDHFTCTEDLTSATVQGYDNGILDVVMASGYVLIQYKTMMQARKAVSTMDQSFLHGKKLCVRFNRGIQRKCAISTLPSSSTSYSVSKQNPLSLTSLSSSSSAVPSSSSLSSSSSSSFKGCENAYYTSDSLVLPNGVEFPISTGKYLMKLLERRHKCNDAWELSLFDILLNQQHSKRRCKEITECMGMVNSLYRALHLIQLDTQTLDNVTVYCVADGYAPYNAATMLLFISNTSWKYVSIDPQMEYDVSNLASYHPIKDRLSVLKQKSQDYIIKRNDRDESGSCSNMSIVIACHSHAPLQEFWDRVATPKIAIVMPCCGKTWSSLNESPILTFEDYEILSPRRKIFIYHRDNELH